jgi:hypothetical protein
MRKKYVNRPDNSIKSLLLQIKLKCSFTKSVMRALSYTIKKGVVETPPGCYVVKALSVTASQLKQKKFIPEQSEKEGRVKTIP